MSRTKEGWTIMDEKDEKPESWYECIQCGSISDDNTFVCSVHWTETPRVLLLTPKEVVDRVWPDWLKIRTGCPSKFDGLREEVRRERAVASVRKEQESKAVPA